MYRTNFNYYKTHDRYLYQGQEMDDEVKGEGNSYDFGARIYDAKLGRFLSIDRLAKKHPGLSSYSFVNNSPVIAVDKDGNDWTISTTIAEDGSRTVHVKLTAAAVNNSSEPVDMNAFAATVKSQVEKSFTGSYVDSKTTFKNDDQPGVKPDLLVPETQIFKVNVVVDVDIRIIKDTKQVKSTEHLIRIEDNDVATREAGGTQINGMANEMGGTDIVLDRSRLDDMMNGLNNNTIPHEFGHTLGLHHIDQLESPKNYQYLGDVNKGKFHDNLMLSGQFPGKDRTIATKLEGFQMKWAINAIKNGKVNKQ